MRKSEQGSQSQVSVKAIGAALVRPVTATLEGSHLRGEGRRSRRPRPCSSIEV